MLVVLVPRAWAPWGGSRAKPLGILLVFCDFYCDFYVPQLATWFDRKLQDQRFGGFITPMPVGHTDDIKTWERNCDWTAPKTAVQFRSKVLGLDSQGSQHFKIWHQKMNRRVLPPKCHPDQHPDFLSISFFGFSPNQLLFLIMWTSGFSASLGLSVKILTWWSKSWLPCHIHIAGRYSSPNSNGRVFNHFWCQALLMRRWLRRMSALFWARRLTQWP